MMHGMKGKPVNDPIDVEVTHIETRDDATPLSDETTGIVIDTNKHALPPMTKVDSSKLPATIGDRLPALRVDVDAADQLDYEEDCDILHMLCNKVFRRAIIAGVELSDMPSIEEVGDDMSDVFSDLDAARDGRTDVHWRLAEWKQTLAPTDCDTP